MRANIIDYVFPSPAILGKLLHDELEEADPVRLDSVVNGKGGKYYTYSVNVPTRRDFFDGGESVAGVQCIIRDCEVDGSVGLVERKCENARVIGPCYESGLT